MINKSEIVILKGGEVYSPKFQGKQDLIIAGNKILVITDELGTIKLPKAVSIQEIDITDHYIIPGLIDLHEHLIGGGGEAGPESMIPEAKLSELVSSGITTVVGVLGTDAVSRSLTSLLAKVKALNHEGLTAYMYTGSYRVPTVTITESISQDIVLISEIIGTKVAISDHRSSYPTYNELVKLTSESRVAGLLSQKAGIVHLHVGSDSSKLDLLFKIIKNTDIPILQFLPTHMSRTEALTGVGQKWIAQGGFIDLTASKKTAKVLDELRQDDIPIRCTVSSDAYGSLPHFDADGNITEIKVSKPASLLKTIRLLYNQYDWSIEEILPIFTSNPAKILKINKGYLAVNKSADLLVLDKELSIKYVFAKGKALMTPDWTKKALFES